MPPPSEPRTTPERRAPRFFSRVVLLLAVGCGGGAGSPSTDAGTAAADDANAGNTPNAGVDSSGDAPSGGPMSTPLLDGDALPGTESGPGPDAGGSGSPPPDAAAPPPLSLPATDRASVSLGDGWKFMASNTLTGAEAVGFNDSTWATVSVPHTWDSVTARATRSRRTPALGERRGLRDSQP